MEKWKYEKLFFVVFVYFNLFEVIFSIFEKTKKLKNNFFDKYALFFVNNMTIDIKLIRGYLKHIKFKLRHSNPLIVTPRVSPPTALECDTCTMANRKCPPKP